MKKKKKYSWELSMVGLSFDSVASRRRTRLVRITLSFARRCRLFRVWVPGGSQNTSSVSGFHGTYPASWGQWIATQVAEVMSNPVTILLWELRAVLFANLFIFVFVGYFMDKFCWLSLSLLCFRWVFSLWKTFTKNHGKMYWKW